MPKEARIFLACGGRVAGVLPRLNECRPAAARQYAGCPGLLPEHGVSRGFFDEAVIVASSDTAEPTRRDFLYIATGAVAAVGGAAAVWPFVAQMNPDASVQALAEIEVDLSAIEEGQNVTVKWQGKPVFIRYRTPAEIEEARSVPLAELPDQVARNANVAVDASAADENRAVRPEWLIQIGICTHLGCVPVGEAGDFDGWFCPCHGSHYDSAGRIRKGPAPENLAIPRYVFKSDTTVLIG
jgi:ubiquinol-cytochrome c reductase iron-sulfur subunit